MVLLRDIAVLVRHVMSATTILPTPSLPALSTVPSIGGRRTDLRSHGGARIQRRYRARTEQSNSDSLPIARQNHRARLAGSQAEPATVQSLPIQNP